MNDPWYKRTEFWTMVAGVLQCPVVSALPVVGPYAQMGSAALAALAPLLYIKGRGDVKAALATPGIVKIPAVLEPAPVAQ